MGDVITKMADIAKETMDTYHCDLISDGLFLGRIEERDKGRIDVIWMVRQTGTDIMDLNYSSTTWSDEEIAEVARTIADRNELFFHIRGVGSSSLRSCDIKEIAKKEAKKLIKQYLGRKEHASHNQARIKRSNPGLPTRINSR